MAIMQSLQLVKGQKILIAPFSPLTEKLARDLQDCDISIIGFVDQYKQANNIIHPSSLKRHSFDKVFILSPNHALTIYQNLLNEGVVKKTLTLLKPERNYRPISRWALRLSKYLASIKPFSLAWLQKISKGYLHDNKTVLLLTKDFVDLNIKDFYLELERSTYAMPIIATDNTEQYRLLKESNFKVVYLFSWYFVWLSLKAKVKVLDHSPITKELILTIQYSKVIQIWHGIPLKKIGHLINYKMVHYNLVVSTSAFVTQYAFSKLFNTDGFIESGYPRNDIFQQGVIDKRQLVLVNKPIYQWLQQRSKPLIIYMPTWRGYPFDTNPINLDDLEQFANEENLTIVIKMHPFIRPETFFDSLESEKYTFNSNYKHNIIFYPSTDDIYPLLSQSDLLITDYSSVYFDYLLLNKPILFFTYDLQLYKTYHGDFMLDFSIYTPGDKVDDYAALKQGIIANLKDDKWQSQRQLLRDKLFDTSIENSSQQLGKAVKSFLDK